jgi:hypothetical protein
MRPHKRDVSGHPRFFEANNRIFLVDSDFNELAGVFLINATGEQFQVECLPLEFHATH